ncbi:MAG: apolipoprotein N-acyltransferase [Cyanobacteriota bacterium]|nr:apolipoprotein N-acyltransferase [Cyanobacteriota bacterium]
MTMGNDRRLRLLLAAAAGSLAGLSLPPLGWPWLLWPALAVLWSLAGSPQGVGAGCLWGLAAVLLSHRWLPALHPLDWVGVPSALSLPLCLLLWLLCALLGGALVAAWVALVRRLDPARLSTALLAAGLWGGTEVVLAKGPLFWIGLGASPLPGDPWLAGMAALVGAGGVATLQVLLGWGLWRVVRTWRWRWGLALLMGLLFPHLLGAAAMAAQADTSTPSATETVLVVQPAIPTRQKFLSGQQVRLLQLLVAALGEAQPQGATVVLPEGALPLDQPLPEPAPVEVISGGFRRSGPTLRSALLRFAPQATVATSWVDKHRVVPLGEWVPLAPLFRWSGLSAVGGIEGGSASRLLQRPSGAIGVAICYEIADGQALAQASRDGAGWLLASANLDPYPLALQRQFQALAQLRALESGRWLVSAANTGPSVLVNPVGRVVAALPPGQSSTGLFTVTALRRSTPYLLAGEAPLVAVLAAGGLLRAARL